MSPFVSSLLMPEASHCNRQSASAMLDCAAASKADYKTILVVPSGDLDISSFTDYRPQLRHFIDQLVCVTVNSFDEHGELRYHEEDIPSLLNFSTFEKISFFFRSRQVKKLLDIFLMSCATLDLAN
jgi:hypothetical protein